LVAIKKDSRKILEHILLSKIRISIDNQVAESLALAPVSVLPDYQNKGVGKLLILEALISKKVRISFCCRLRSSRILFKVWLQKASLWGIKAPFKVPDEALMAIKLEKMLSVWFRELSNIQVSFSNKYLN
jgi:predicted N-acetyltransferase YhbS